MILNCFEVFKNREGMTDLASINVALSGTYDYQGVTASWSASQDFSRKTISEGDNSYGGILYQQVPNFYPTIAQFYILSSSCWQMLYNLRSSTFSPAAGSIAVGTASGDLGDGDTGAGIPPTPWTMPLYLELLYFYGNPGSPAKTSVRAPVFQPWDGSLFELSLLAPIIWPMDGGLYVDYDTLPNATLMLDVVATGYPGTNAEQWLSFNSTNAFDGYAKVRINGLRCVLGASFDVTSEGRPGGSSTRSFPYTGRLEYLDLLSNMAYPPSFLTRTGAQIYPIFMNQLGETSPTQNLDSVLVITRKGNGLLFGFIGAWGGMSIADIVIEGQAFKRLPFNLSLTRGDLFVSYTIANTQVFTNRFGESVSRSFEVPTFVSDFTGMDYPAPPPGSLASIDPLLFAFHLPLKTAGRFFDPKINFTATAVFATSEPPAIIGDPPVIVTTGSGIFSVIGT